MFIPRVALARFRSVVCEQCGIVIGKGDEIVRVVKVRNFAAEIAADKYAISMDDFLRVQNELSDGEFVVGFLHTHLPEDTPYPSDADFEGCEIFPHFLNFVYHPASGITTMYGSLTEGDRDIVRGTT